MSLQFVFYLVPRAATEEDKASIPQVIVREYPFLGEDSKTYNLGDQEGSDGLPLLWQSQPLQLLHDAIGF